jgi:hypothetical protein
MTMKKSVVLAFALSLMIGMSAALFAETTVNAKVDRQEISEGESVQYTIEIKGEASNLPAIDLGQLQDWQVYSSGTSSNYSWINGRTEQSKQYNFMLSPIRAGRLSIPSFQLTIGGKSYNTQQIWVMVNPVSMPQSRNVPPSSGRQRAQGSRQQQPSRDDILLRCTVNRDTVYVNQQVTMSVKFYYRVRLLANPEPRIPQRTGFWAEDLGQWRTDQETLNGRDYNLAELRTALFPTAPGTQTIGSAEMNVVVDDGGSNDPFSLFNQGFPGFGGGRRLTLKSDPVKIVTLPLPEAGKPADFGGAVGQYQMTALVDKNKIEVNEPLTLHIKISGIGNIKSVAIPKVPDLPDFRNYQAGDNEKVEKVNYQVGGTKTFDQVFIPKRAGTYLLPSLRFSYFDPQARTYKTVSSEQIQVEVTPSKDRYASQVQNVQTNRIDLTAKDIRYLKTSLGELGSRRSAPISASPWFLAVMYMLPILGYVAVLARQRHKERLLSDVGFRRLRQSRKLADSRLAKAKGLLDAADADSFYSEINRSLIDYFADRYNLPAFGLTADKIKEYAVGRQSDVLVEQLLDLLQQCDFGRFAPGGSEKTQMTQLWENAKNLIVELEKTR